jgi:hypothetical protein
MKTDDPPTLMRELRRLADLDGRDEQLRSELRALLLERTRPHPLQERRPRRRWHLQPRLSLAVGLAAAAIAVVVSVFGLAGTAGPASAEAVLRRAGAVRFAPEQTVHLVYSAQQTDNGQTSTGTGDVWLDTDANGTPILVAETFSRRTPPSAPARLVERAIETPAGVYTYDAEHNTIVIPSHTASSSLSPHSPTVPLPAFLFNGATVAHLLQPLGTAAQGGARLLGQRTLDGSTVDAVQVDGWPDGGSRVIFYFDTESHLLRGFDVANTDPSSDAASWQARLASEQTTPADATPPSTFKLNAPTNADVQPPGPDSDVLARLCPTNLKLLIVQGQSLLTACQSKTPGLTEDALVAALAASIKTDLDAAVAAGVTTQAQAAQALATQQTQLRAFVTTSGPPPAPAKQKTATTSGGK